MREDPVMIGAIAGFIGTVVKEVLNGISVMFDWSGKLYWHMAASVFVLPHDVKKPGALLLGALGDFITGAFFGIAVVYVLRLTGRRFAYIKGLGVAWMVWLGLFGLVANLDIIRLTPVGIETGLSGFVTHTFFGLATVWAILRWEINILKKM